MKNILILLLLFFVPLFTYSQHPVNKSLQEVFDYAKSKGYKYEGVYEREGKSDVYCFSVDGGLKSGGTDFMYFIQDNKCTIAKQTCSLDKQKNIIETLNKYWNNDGDSWWVSTDETLAAYIKYSDGNMDVYTVSLK